MRDPAPHQCRRRAARRAALLADLRDHREVRQADPAASDPHPRNGRLPHRDEVEIRDLQRDRLALRDRRRARAPGVLRHHGRLSEPEGDHAPSRRHHSVFRGPGRPFVGPARRAHLGRGLRRVAQAAEEAALRLLQGLLRRHRARRQPRRDRVRHRFLRRGPRGVRVRLSRSIRRRDAAIFAPPSLLSKALQLSPTTRRPGFAIATRSACSA